LATFDPKRNHVIRYKNPSEEIRLLDLYVMDLHEDRNKNFWIGTSRAGLFKLNRKNGAVLQWLHQPEKPNSISSNAVTDILEISDPQNHSKYYLLLGTEGGGLNWFDPETGISRAFTVSDGLSDNTISSIVMDNIGFVWISTGKGLTRFDPKNKTFQNYDQRDGLPFSEFNPWAGMKSRTGKLYFGTPQGIIFFDPKELSADESDNPLPVVFTGLEVFNKLVTVGNNSPLSRSIVDAETISLSHRDFIFSLKFAMLDFKKPEQNLYAYKMEGLHGEWIDLGNRARVDFTGLAPGEYVLRVKAANSKGIWNHEGATLKVFITPPFWQTWWFRLLVLAALLGLLYTFYRMRLERLLEVERTRTGIARDLHDEVSATLSGISWFAKAARSEEEAGKNRRNFMDNIIDSASDAQEKIKDIIWAIQPEHDKWEQLFAHCQRYAADLLESNGIKPEMEFQPPEGSKEVDMKTRQNFWLLFKEILVNAVKHSKCNIAKINMIAEGRAIHLEIIDDGIGFDTTQESKGNGLANIRSRAETLGAECRLFSEPGKGTSWKIRLQI
jgi:signal transduction histidine kinase